MRGLHVICAAALLVTTAYGNSVATEGEVRDKHGCLLSGGYNWCEKLDKCIIVVEEIEALDFDNDGEVTTSEYAQGCLVLHRTVVNEPREAVLVPEEGEEDEDGCVRGAGYRWCERVGKCVRGFEQMEWLDLNKDGQLEEWEYRVACEAVPTAVDEIEAAPKIPAGLILHSFEIQPVAVGVDDEIDIHGCNRSGDYQWCEKMIACLRTFDVPEGTMSLDLNNDGKVTAGEFAAGCADVAGTWYTPIPVDAHDGCSSSAGYQWCEKMGACVRGFEETETLDFNEDGKVTEEEFKKGCAGDSSGTAHDEL